MKSQTDANFQMDIRTLGQISAAGCQSPRDLTRRGRGEPDFWREDGVAEIGRRLAAAVDLASPSAAARVDFAPVMRHAVRNITLPRRRVARRDFVAAKANLDELATIMTEGEAYRDFCEEVGRNEKIPGRPGPYDSKLHPFVLIQNNKAVVSRYEEQNKQPGFDMEMHVLRLGAAAFVSCPFELFLEYGQRIKARSPAEQTFIVQLCGGTGGYLPTARAEQLGGYGGLIINGQVGSDGGTKLVDIAVAYIEKLWE